MPSFRTNRCTPNKSTMKTLTCGCLNVKIHVKKTDKIVNFAQLGIGRAVSEPFFMLEIADAQLDLGGITIAQQVLVRERNVSGWMVHQCLNCELLTHATHGSGTNSKVLVNLALKMDQTSIESSADYSPLYKMVLHSRGNDNQNKPSMLNLHTGKYEHLNKTLTTIQQQLANFIESEKRAMEERIRSFEAQQKANFANLKNKVSRDKNALISLVLAVKETSDNDPESDILLDGPDSPVSDDRPDEPSPDFSDGPQRQKFFSPITPIKNKPEVSRPKDIAKKSNDDDDMFDLDGLDDEYESSRPFYASDDDNEDTDDSSINDDMPYSSRISGRGHTPRMMMTSNLYSQSVPISMPQWRPFSTHSSLEEDDERAPDPEDMAASIKALARSVHGDGTEIFGDLPRRRLNTMELGKI